MASVSPGDVLKKPEKDATKKAEKDIENPVLQSSKSKSSTSERVGFFEQVWGRSRSKKSSKQSKMADKSKMADPSKTADISNDASRVENAYHGKRDTHIKRNWFLSMKYNKKKQ